MPHVLNALVASSRWEKMNGHRITGAKNTRITAIPTSIRRFASQNVTEAVRPET